MQLIRAIHAGGGKLIDMILMVSNPSMRPPVVKLLFRLRRGLLLQSPIELMASLNVRLLSASNELLSALASFARHPMLYSPKGDSGSAGEPEGGTIPSKNQKCKWSILLRSGFLILPRITHTAPRCATGANCIR